MYEEKETYGITRSFKEWEEKLSEGFLGFGEDVAYFTEALRRKPIFMLSPSVMFESVEYHANVTTGTIAQITSLIELEEAIPYVLLRSKYPKFDSNGMELFIYRGYWKK